jgi:hypothetical protein
MDGVGAQYEIAVHSLLNPFASLVSVPRQDDFGIDFYCHLRRPTGIHTETVSDLAALQVKGGEASLVYGGADARGDWRKHEIAWLMSLSTPLYLVKIPRDRKVVDIFSLGPVWHRFMAQAVYPFEIACTTQPPSVNADWQLTEPTFTVGPERGDRRRWMVDLGAPIVRVSVEDSDDPSHRERVALVLRTWIANDRQNLMRFLQGIPVFSGFSGWQTNSLNGLRRSIAQHWSATPGENIASLCQTGEPLLVNLGIHLQWQNDQGAYALTPTLEWLNQRGQLGGIGQGLLRGLIETQRNGVGPRDEHQGQQIGLEVSPSPPEEG